MYVCIYAHIYQNRKKWKEREGEGKHSLYIWIKVEKSKAFDFIMAN